MTDFSFFSRDLAGLALGTVLIGVFMVLPGILLAWGANRSATRPTAFWQDWASVIGLILVPLIDAIAIRIGGIVFAVCLNLLMAAGAVTLARSYIPKPNVEAAIFGLLWWLFCAGLYADIDICGRLNQGVVVLDLVKHAAVVREIAANGLPLQDPFFLRATPAGYYHYFYDVPALADRFGGRAVDSRMAFTAGSFWCGLLFVTFLRNFIRELRWQIASDRRLYVICAAICTIGGLDLLGVSFRYFLTGILEANSEWWDDEISLVPTAASWVPHHLSAVVAVFFGIVLLTRSLQTGNDRSDCRNLRVLAGVTFASAFGLSLWVSVAAAFVLIAALRWLAPEERRSWMTGLAIAGAVAGALSIPQFVDLLQGREPTDFPLKLQFRDAARISEILPPTWATVISILTMPLVWAAEFGLLSLGGYLFFKSNRFFNSSPLARILKASFVVALVLNFTLRSAILNNDFGWRCAWFAAVPLMLWTVAILQAPLPKKWRSTAVVLFALGLAATAYNLLAARLARAPWANSGFAYLNVDPKTDYAMRQAYEWANSHLPENAVLQHNPADQPRVVNFGLYSIHRTAVADYEGELFGASRRAVKGRTFEMGRVFAGLQPVGVARAEGVQFLIVTLRDPLWGLARADCVYANERVCVLDIRGERETYR